MTTAVLEFQVKEDLYKLLKAAKIFGLYAKERKELVAVRQKISINGDEKRRIAGKQALALLGKINQRAEIAGIPEMSLEEINDEIAQARRKRAVRCRV